MREYLPAPLGQDELQRVVDRAIEETGGGRDERHGKTSWAAAMELSEGRAEGRELSVLVRARLQQ